MAQEIETEEKEDLANYAFAAHLGTGIYRASGRTVQIYSLPISYTLRPVEDNNWGVKLKFPVTVGFFDFKARDIIDSGPPDDVATISVLPGVEFQFPVRDNWFLMPFGDLYFNLAFLRFRDDSFEVHVQYELGFTLARRQPRDFGYSKYPGSVWVTALEMGCR